MTNPHPRFQGIWLPLVSPFQDGKLDEAALRRLVRAYAGRVDGFVLGATTGEGLALSADELCLIVQCAAEELEIARAPTPILVGLAGAVTSAVVQSLRTTETWPVDGFLVTCPYYVRPSQEGLRLHFEAIAAGTDKDLLVYNIPYRTGVNLQNDTLLRLAEQRNIVGVKDCCADHAQTEDLINRKPPGFSVLAGDDASLARSLRAGADGGVAASAHLDPEGFRRLRALEAEGRQAEADALWNDLASIPELLFAEPSPAPLKHRLWRMGLIGSPEVRLPMIPVSDDLALRLDQVLERQDGASGA
jgi:4-hydroxy-tetrahydrodipicolinate synthase